MEKRKKGNRNQGAETTGQRRRSPQIFPFPRFPFFLLTLTFLPLDNCPVASFFPSALSIPDPKTRKGYIAVRYFSEPSAASSSRNSSSTVSGATIVRAISSLSSSR